MSQTKAQLLNPLGELELTGQLVGVGATFSGNVSIAGTLTKQDVTNVDSVGVITARSGVNVTSGGIDVAGGIDVTSGNVFIGQGGSGANNAELKLQAGAGTGNDIIAFLNQAGTTKGNITYDTDNNFMMFNTDGAERARIDSNGDINLGNNPTNQYGYKLNIQDSSILYAQTASSGGTELKLHLDNSADLATFGTVSSDNLALVTNNLERLRITSNGSVGINSTSPTAAEKLCIRGGTSDSAKFTFHSYADFLGASDAWEGYSALFRGSKASNPNSQWLGIGATTAYGWIDFANNSASKITITSTGVGLGVNNPEGLLHLFGDNNTNGPELYLTVNNNNTSDNIGALIYGNNSDKTLLKIQGLTHTANNTGDLTFHTSTAGTMGERLRIGSAGQIGIAGANYGTAGQVIVSGGSGAAVAWADAGGAPEVEGTVSGSISSGDAVIVKTDGDIEKVVETISPTSNPGNANNSLIVNQNDTSVTKMIWCKGTDRLIALYCLSNEQIMIRIGVISSSGITWTPSGLQGHQGLDTYWGMSCVGLAKFDMAWDEDAQQLLIVCGQKNYDYIQGRFFTVSDTAISATTGRFTIWSASNSGYRIRENCVTVKKLGNRKFIAGWIASGNDMYGKMRVIELNSAGNNYTQGTLSQLPTGTSPDERLVAINFGDPNAAGDIPVTFLKYNNNNGNKLFGRACTVSGTTISYGSEVQMSSATSGYGVYVDTNNYTLWPSISYDEDNDVYLVNYREHRGGGGNKFFCRGFKCTGTTFATIGSEKQLGSNTPQNLNIGTYDPIYNKHVVWVTDNYGIMKYFVVTTTTTGTPTTTSETATSTGIAETYSFPFVGATSFNAEYNRHIILGTTGSGGGQMYRWIFGPFATSSTNMTAENFIGFSDAAYTNGQTGKVLTIGNQTTKSGLTPGKKYYVQKNGSVKTSTDSPSVQAGTSILSTKLLINF